MTVVGAEVVARSHMLTDYPEQYVAFAQSYLVCSPSQSRIATFTASEE